MKNKIAYLLALCALWSTSQTPATAQQTQHHNGWPTAESAKNLHEGFATPPSGYGNVPFFWLNGDTLKKERMTDILDQMKAAYTSGFSASYIHKHSRIDSVEHREKGYSMFGRTEPGEPKVFSEEWWSFWNWFSGACAERGMGLGMDDYTMAWYGNGYYPDEVYNRPKYKNYQGRLEITEQSVAGGMTYTAEIPEHLVSATAFQQNNPQAKPIDLAVYINAGKLNWQAPATGKYTVYIAATQPDYLLHPDNGKELVEVYFDRFDKKMDAKGRDGMNYFFQDELLYPLTILTWAEDMPAQFKARKGYDILPYLAALKYNVGNITAKVRLDYCDVVVTLAEERYFKPIFDWNDSRGLIYGCDNMGRGKQPLHYLDYFRASSWFTAPGNDAPARGSSFIQTKVSSSVGHLYQRPRTWLEAFHSMGWGSKTEWLTEQIDHHFLAGGNLVCMHGLYYSTHGGWWEWAPPCFHYHMPYWPHMKRWLEYTERLSYLMSQGDHVCDIAVLYPTETMQVYDSGTPYKEYDFSYVMDLSNAGLDYDFIDNRSLTRASIDKGELSVGHEKYKVIILKDIRALRYEALLKVRDFYRQGGIVVASGDLPEASDHAGSNDPEVDKIIKEIFGMTAAQTETIAVKAQYNPNGGGRGFYVGDFTGVPSAILRTITPDFRPGKSGGKVLHRRTADRDVYMVMNVQPGTNCFFRTKGKAELWNAFDGTTQPLPVARVTENGTIIRLDAPENRSSLVVFSPGEPVMDTAQHDAKTADSIIPITGPWEVEARPTLENKWGDFRLPASEGMIGIEARRFRFIPLRELGKTKTWMEPQYNDSTWTLGTYGFGAPLEVLADGSSMQADGLAAAVNNDVLGGWKPYAYSWQYGVENNPGSQGYHGLKGRVDNNFLILDQAKNMLFRTQFYVPESGFYALLTGNVTPDGLYIDGESIQSAEIVARDRANGQKETRYTVELRKGWHSLLAVFCNTTDQPLRQEAYDLLDPRTRSALVIVPLADSAARENTPYDDIVATKWYRTQHLTFDREGGRPQKTVYRFLTAPGLQSMKLNLAGTLEKAWVDGIAINAKLGIRETAPGHYTIDLPVAQPKTCQVTLQITPEAGFDGTAVFLEPVQLLCGKGVMEAGDWSKEGSLLYYSGGMYYRKSIDVTEQEIARGVTLDLGQVSASCEIKVNGRDAGIHIYSPFSADITPYLHAGENQIEVLVYSTLANHYQTSATPYKGDPEAGLIGPVRLVVGGR